MSKQSDRVQRATTKLVMREPFFASLLLRLKFEETSAVKTFCTDGRRLLFNPDWAANLTEDQIRTVLGEEVLHCALGHLWRAPAGCDWQTWNLAADQEARWIMMEHNQAKGTPIPFPFPTKANEPQDRFRGVAAEKVYSTMMGEKPGPQPEPKGKGNDKGKGGGKQNPKGQNPGQGQGDDDGNGQPGNQPADGDQAAGPGGDGIRKQGGGGGKGQKQTDEQPAPWGGEFKQPEQTSEQRKLQKDWDEALIQSASMFKGDAPGQCKRRVKDLTTVRADWRQLLRDFLRETCRDDYSWTVPNARYAGGDFIMPSLHSERAGRLVFATDTSGSVSDGILSSMRAEKQSALDELQPSTLTDIYCDAEVTRCDEYTPGDTIGTDAPGGGGTDFRPVFAKLEKDGDVPTCLVYLTDLYGTFPSEEPPYPVLWVCWSGETKAPFGTVVNILQEEQ